MATEDYNMDETDRVSGTLDAVAAYIEKEFGLSALDAAKVSTLLWLEQECEIADAEKSSELNVGLKSLTDFGDEGSKAQGMVANSRLFININRAMVTALASIPAEIVEDLLLQSEIDKITVKVLLRVAHSFKKSSAVIPDGLVCVCMRAWRYIKKQKHVPFQAKDVMPCKEDSRKETSRLVCELTQDDGRQRLGKARWQCPYYEDVNYCRVTPERVEQMLDILEQQGILVAQGTSESPGSKSYLFL